MNARKNKQKPPPPAGPHPALRTNESSSINAAKAGEKDAAGLAAGGISYEKLLQMHEQNHQEEEAARKASDLVAAQVVEAQQVEHSRSIAAIEHTETKKQPCSHCKVEAGTKLCSACRQVGYCSGDCQKAHWKAHKAECKRHQAAAK